jgi:hypothetical protein
LVLSAIIIYLDFWEGGELSYVKEISRHLSYDQNYPLNRCIFHDILPESKKLKDIRIRRIELKYNREIFTIVPSFILPYMVGFVEDVEKPLFLRHFAIPFWALTYVFGKNDMYWYRIENRFGRNSIVGTTIKSTINLPTDVIGDEKHSRENGDKIYIATTVANDCILGVSIANDASTESLGFSKKQLHIFIKRTVDYGAFVEGLIV